MPRTLRGPLPVALALDTAAPLFAQLYDGLRQAILVGRLRPAARLPASRALADDLGVSRNTVLAAYQQLLAEGYLEGKAGSGTYVSRALPDDAFRAERRPAPQRVPVDAEAGLRRLSARGRVMATAKACVCGAGPPIRPFRPGVPALDAFPFATWGRLWVRRWRSKPTSLLHYGEPAGYRPLREALAEYLGTARAVRCTADQVIVAAGTQQAVDVVARLLLDPGDQAWIEDPGYTGARAAFLAAGAKLVPVPVDADGLDVAAGLRRAPAAKLAYLTPSHQYPTGALLSAARRLALLEWARKANAWIIEDDYDSEFRYCGRPLPAMQGLDQTGRVVYIGTLSKVLFPGLRLAYLVVPPDLADAFAAAQSVAVGHLPYLTQAVLADFIGDGHFARHLRRVRTLCAQRQEALVAAAAELADRLEVRAAPAGLHLVGRLPPGSDDAAFARRAATAGVETPPLSAYAIEPMARPGVLLGYAGYTPRQLREGVRRLATLGP